MRVLYIGQLWRGSTCLERAKVLAEYGWDVVEFDVTTHLGRSSRFAQAIQHRLMWGPDVSRFNKDLVTFARGLGHADVVWIDKGLWVWPATVETLKTITGAVVVHYTPDPAFAVHTSRHFSCALPLYDLCVTTKRYELDRYRQAGARDVVFTWQGIDDRFVALDMQNVADEMARGGVVFIGHAERHYGEVLASVGHRHPELKIWGPGWERYATKHAAVRAFVRGGPIWGSDYTAELARASIGLGLLSKYCPDQFTTRTFEIPAAGALLVAERTEEHRELFEEGKEAEFYSSTEELEEKIDFYLRHDQARRRIAERGRRKTLSCYHWKHVLMPAIRAVEEMLT